MKKRLITMMLVLAAIATTARAATDYKFWIGGVKVTSANCNNVTGSAIKGSVVYTPGNNTVTLTNVTISRTGSNGDCITSDNENLTVKFVGTNTLTTDGAAAIKCRANTKIIVASGTTTVKATTDAPLYLNDFATVTLEGPGKLNLTSTAYYGIQCWWESTLPKAHEIHIQNQADVTITSKRNCLFHVDHLIFKGDCGTLTLKATNDSGYPNVWDLASFKFGDALILQPAGAYYSSSLKSFTTDGKNRIYNKDIVISNKGIVAIDATNFPDGKFRSYLVKQSYGGDGKLTPVEIAAVTTMNVSNEGISNLKGIEHFTALTTLNCNNNSLSSLDVSKNTALTDLRVANNKLTSLNVSNNKKLLNLFCNGNQINKTAMQTLVNSLPPATNSYLVAIDTKNSSEGNVITKSQVTEAKNKKWNVQDYNGGSLVAYAGSDPGIAINSTNFPDANFRSFVSGTTIDKDKDGYLSTTEIAAVTYMSVYNKSIANLKGVEHFTALKTVDCYGNKLTSIDVSKNTNLETLYCYRNQLTSLDVSKNTKLKTIYCFVNQITGDKMTAFVNSLPKVTSGQLVIIDTKNSTEKNVVTKAQVTTAKNKGWTVQDRKGGEFVSYAGLDLGIAIDQSYFPDKEWRSFVTTNYDKDKDGYLSDAEIKAVTSISVTDKTIANFKGIDIFTELTSLVINRCKTTSLDVSKNTKLTNLNVTTNSLSSLNVSKNTLLKTLYCGANQLSALNVSANTALTTLYCHKNKLTALDVSKNTKLTTLYVYINQIKTSSAMQTLVNGLPKVTGTQLWVIDTKDKSEGNVITKAQVTVAKNKGWSVYNYNGGSGVNYAGSDDPTPVEAIEADADPQNARWYTIDGKKLSGEPTKKGIYIRNGKKVVK